MLAHSAAHVTLAGVATEFHAMMSTNVTVELTTVISMLLVQMPEAVSIVSAMMVTVAREILAMILMNVLIVSVT